jgi:hypothetical protein
MGDNKKKGLPGENYKPEGYRLPHLGNSWKVPLRSWKASLVVFGLHGQIAGLLTLSPKATHFEYFPSS